MNSILTYREIVEILTLIKESEHCARLSLEIGDFKLDVQGTSAHMADHTRQARATQDGDIKAPSSSVSSTYSSSMDSMSQTPIVEAINTSGEQFIRAPILGIFYRASEPGAKPFVEVGDEVMADDTVAVMEVMKLYSTVDAGIAGKILEILVDDGQMVEYNQPLMRVALIEAAEQV